jgi:diketogulonate reductase-like aldo/keto reductase
METVDCHGARIPKLGLGTFRLNGDVARTLVEAALDQGYRPIDTAAMYGNEAEIGETLAGSSVPRDEIFLTTKIWPDDFKADDFQRAVDRSLEKLRTVPDLLLLHWPSPEVPLAETMAALNEVQRQGQARHIGVSNFPTALLTEAKALAEGPLAVNQVEYHVYLDQSAVLGAVRAAKMGLIAYSPIAQGRVFQDPVLIEIAAKHERNPGQIALRWLLQQDRVIAIPRSSKPAHAAANLAVFEFALSAEETARIDALARPDGRLISPAWGPAWDS